MKKIVEAKYTSLRFDEKTLGPNEMGFDCASAGVSCVLQTYIISLTLRRV